jgi:hypothetical protein
MEKITKSIQKSKKRDKQERQEKQERHERKKVLKKFAKWGKVKTRPLYPDPDLFTIYEDGEVLPDTNGVYCGKRIVECEGEYESCRIPNCGIKLEPSCIICIYCMYRYRFYLEPLDGKDFLKKAVCLRGDGTGLILYLCRRNSTLTFEEFIGEWKLLYRPVSEHYLGF